jgi:hypothetical protein
VTIPRYLGICLVAALITMVNPVFGQTAAPAQQTAQPPAHHTERQAPPTRDPNAAGYVVAKELPDGANPPVMRTVILSSGLRMRFPLMRLRRMEFRRVR